MRNLSSRRLPKIMVNKLTEKQISRILFLTGILLLLSEIWKQITINLVLKAGGEGQYYWWYFPFQLCSTPMYVCLLLLPANRNGRKVFFDALLTYLATFGLLAGVFTFVDTSGFSELGYLPLTIHSWVWHILMVIMGVFCFAWLASRNRSHFAGAVGLFIAGCSIAEVINLTAGRQHIVNMFYISPLLKMNQACFKDIAGYLGNGWAIFVYIVTIIIGAAVVEMILLASSKN